MLTWRREVFFTLMMLYRQLRGELVPRQRWIERVNKFTSGRGGVSWWRKV